MKKNTCRYFLLILSVSIIILMLLNACADNSDKKPYKPTASATLFLPIDETTPKTTSKATASPTAAPTAKPIKIISDQPKTVCLSPNSPSQIAIQLRSSIAIQFCAAAPFNGIDLLCPSWGDAIGTLDFNVCAWKGNYIDTVESKPLAAFSHKNYEDNALLESTFDELPAGEYLLYITSPEPSEGVGIWAMEYEKGPNIVWENDFGKINCSAKLFNVHYTKTPEIDYGDLSWGSIY